MAAHRPRAPCLLPLLLLTVQVLSQDLSLSDALDDYNDPQVTTVKPGTAAGPGGKGLSIEDLLKVGGVSITTKAPASVTPKAPKSTRQPSKPRTKPEDGGFDLADALKPVPGENNKGQGGTFSDQDLVNVGNDGSYKPDKGKGSAGGSSQINSSDDTNETTAEVGTIAGIVSAVAMALVGAVTSYISYQKKKFCFSIQQSLNAEMNKNESPEGVVATEPQA
ncbi:CD99 antigen-like protein 2 [Oryzias melastigma]|uniref:CD99 antigen-like protein 2 n=1 Tax=Oryzias melastigma TaxID=30732 RepID=A0A3B3BB11_ORYME|nr:CD99 antigen-like protein 2 [Oryzias melastigma]